MRVVLAGQQFRTVSRDFRLFRFFFSRSACFSKVPPPENLQSWVKYHKKSESYGKEFRWTKFNAVVVVVVDSLLNQINPRAQNVSRPWRELQRRYKSDLRSTEHESPHGTIETPRTPRSRGGGRTNAAFMPPRTIKILGEGRPRGPRRVHANAHIDTWRGNQSFRITRQDYWRSEITRHR